MQLHSAQVQPHPCQDDHVQRCAWPAWEAGLSSSARQLTALLFQLAARHKKRQCTLPTLNSDVSRLGLIGTPLSRVQ